MKSTFEKQLSKKLIEHLGELVIVKDEVNKVLKKVREKFEKDIKRNEWIEYGDEGVNSYNEGLKKSIEIFRKHFGNKND